MVTGFTNVEVYQSLANRSLSIVEKRKAYSDLFKNDLEEKSIDKNLGDSSVLRFGEWGDSLLTGQFISIM